MPRKSFRVGRSKTGLGLFATRRIRRRELIVLYKGPRITSEESERREARGARYIFELNSKWAVDGATRRNVARYANHSCKPNAEADVIRGKKITIRACRPIKPGTEITYHYGVDYLNNVLTKSGCRCVACTNKRNRRRAQLRKRAKRQEMRVAAQRKKVEKKLGPRVGRKAKTKRRPRR